MKKITTVLCITALLVNIAALTGCKPNGEGSDTPNSPGGSSSITDSSGNSGNSGSSSATESAPEPPKPAGEPTFLTAPDGTPIYTSEISEIYKGSEERGNKETITLEQAKLIAQTGNGYFTVKCDGFVYGYIPERSLNYVDDPEMFKQRENDSEYFDYLGEEFDVNTGEGKYSTEYMRINVGDKFGSLTVKSAYTLFSRPVGMKSFSDIPGAYISDCCVEFDGEIELTGYVNITPEDTFYGTGGDMEFWPDGDSSVKIPKFSYYTNPQTGEICHFSGSHFYGTGGAYSIGNMYKVDCDTSGLQPGDTFVKVKLTLDNVRYVPGDFGGLKVDLKSIEVL